MIIGLTIIVIGCVFSIIIENYKEQKLNNMIGLLFTLNGKSVQLQYNRVYNFIIEAIVIL